MNVTPKDALEVARRLVDLDPAPVAARAAIAQADELHRIADAVDELVAVVRAALVVPMPVPEADAVNENDLVMALVQSIEADKVRRQAADS